MDNDLNKIKNWTIQREMNFNPDPGKQAQEAIFSRKLQKTNHTQVYFNRNSVRQIPSQKHLEMYLDTKLYFHEHLYSVPNIVNKTIGLFRKVHAFLPRQSLVTVYKVFVRPHLDYRNIIYDQT